MSHNQGAAGERSLPSLGLLRGLTDEHVLDQLLRHDALTRAELAARTGISKPTISESVRRLEAAGAIAESGQQSGKRGPSATFYTVHPGAGVALAMAAGPAGVTCEVHDLHGRLIGRDSRPVAHPTTSTVLGPIMVESCRTVLDVAPGPVLAAAVSVANPVDRRTGQLIRLPDSPFLLDELNPGRLLADALPDWPAADAVLVDNDVNWAASAERDAARADGTDDPNDFVYCYLGPGLGLGLVLDGRLIRGHHGLAGELAYLQTEGPDGRSRPLLECFGDWSLLRAGSWEIDVVALGRVLGGSPAPGTGAATAEEVVRAVAGALGSIVALVNPRTLVIAEDWGAGASFVDALADQVARTAALPVEVRPARTGAQAPLDGARAHAVRAAQQALLRR